MTAAADGHQHEPCTADWTFEENKAFELALAKHFSDGDRWDKIALLVPNKTSVDVQKRFRQLQEDICKIEDGRVQLPQCSSGTSDDTGPNKKMKIETPVNGDRRKGVPWTEEEHRLFLLGLTKFGKGDWRSIARNFVISRTPTQVASHAQKYFIRLNSQNKKDKRRASIHDITSAGMNGGSGHGGGALTDQATPGPQQLSAAQQQQQQQHQQHMLAQVPGLMALPAGLGMAGIPMQAAAMQIPMSMAGPSPYTVQM